MDHFLNVESYRPKCPKVIELINSTQQSWVDFPQTQTLTSMVVGPQWRDFNLQELTALTEKGLKMVGKDSTTIQTRLQTLINTTQTDSSQGITSFLTTLGQEEGDKDVMEFILKRSAFTTGFHQVISQGTSYQSLMDNIKSKINSNHPDFAPFSDHDIKFKFQTESYKGSLSRELQANIRNDILNSIPTINAKVKLDHPDETYTFWVLHYILGDKGDAELVNEWLQDQEEMKRVEAEKNGKEYRPITVHPSTRIQNLSLPYAYYFTRQINVKKPEDYFLPTFALNQRPYIGPTSCDTTLAFAMANMTGVDECTAVFDPFNGTGSILCSARKFSPNVLGQDLDIETLYGLFRDKVKKNEEFQKKNVELKQKQLEKRQQRTQYKKDAAVARAASMVNDNTTIVTNDTVTDTPTPLSVIDERSKEQEGGENKINNETPQVQQQQQQRKYPPARRPAQLKGLCKQQDKNIFDNYIHYGFSRPELICADSSHSPYRPHQYTGPLGQKNLKLIRRECPNGDNEKDIIYSIEDLPPQTIPHEFKFTCMEGFKLYKTKNGKPIDDENQALADEQKQFEEEYIQNVQLPLRTAILNRYLEKQNQKLVDSGEQSTTIITTPMSFDSMNQIPTLPFQPVRPSFDVIACDPPYGIRARAAKLANRDTNSDNNANTQATEDAASYISRVRRTHNALREKNNENNNENNTENNNENNNENNDKNNKDTGKQTDEQYNRHQRPLLTKKDVEIGTHVPETVHNPMQNVLYDLFHFAAQQLTLGGKLSFLLPTSKSFPKNLLPTHPCLEIKYAASQVLPTWFDRWCIVMEKTKDYDNDDVTHRNWIQDQFDLGVPLWATSVTARARLLANNQHDIELALLYKAKEEIDLYGYDPELAASAAELQ